MFLRSRITTAVALAAALATAGCGSDSVGPGEFEIDDLVGSWTITRFEYQADSGDETYDLIDNGLSGTAVVQSSGDYTFTVQQTGLPAITTTGRFRFPLRRPTPEARRLPFCPAAGAEDRQAHLSTVCTTTTCVAAPRSAQSRAAPGVLQAALQLLAPHISEART